MKSWTDLLGEPKGNELVWGNEIIRQASQFSFKILWVFDNNTQAKKCFQDWKQENKE